MQDENAISYRLSPQQELVWTMQPDGPTDAGQLIVGLDGSVDVDRLRNAFSLLIDRHEVLRSTYVRQPGMKTPLQVVRDAVALDWEVADLSGLDPAAVQARVIAIAGTERQRSWDYENGPLVSARCLAMAPDRFTLVVTAAPPCVDAGALATIAAELGAQYAGRAVDEQPLQYADFSEWQNQLAVADDEDAEAGRQFWSEAAPGATTGVPFMLRVAPAATETVPVETPSLESVADAYGTSLASLIFAAWVVVLWKLNDGDEVDVASLSARRLHNELETAVGAFSRPLSLQANLGDELTAGDLAAQLVRSQELAERWQDYAPADVDVCGAGFVEVPRVDPISDEGITMTSLGISPPSVFPIALESDGTACVLRYEPSALDRASAERLAHHVECVLASIASSPEKSLAEIGLLDDADVQRLTVEVNNTSTTFPQKAIHELIAHAAASAPTQDAVVDDTGTLSYADLEARSNQVAHRLRSAGVGPDSVVALCTDRSIEMIVGLLGILKAGGAYLPLNFEHPPARLAHQLRETEAPVLVAQESLLERLPEFAGEVVVLDRDRESLDSEPTTPPDVAVSPDNLAYVIYTSGSTGTPKGVGVTHGNLANYVHAVSARLGADEAALAFGMMTAISTDLGNTAVFPALCTGGTLVLVSPGAAADAAAAAEYLRAHPVDVLKITPSHLNALLVGSDAADVLPKRWLVAGGEAFSWDIVARVRELGSCRILNHYGPTETTVGSCTFVVEESDQSPQTATVPIGSPLANTLCYVLDESGSCVPEGVAGELYIAGAGVASGYVGRPDLTEERFLPDPFVGQGRMYATGDLVRRLPDGELEFMGRRDDQVKIRGFRVEPAEVEAALRSNEGVDEAVVIAALDARGEHRLIAYVVASNVTTDELRRHLADWIPEFMIPSTFVPIDAIPRTASGKIDRLSLPSPESVSTPSAGSAYTAPRTPIEEAVAAIWADVLGVEKVGVDDDFFALGGHSLLATQIVAQLRTDFAVNLPLHALFSYPTVASLSQQVVELMGESSDADTQGLIAELEGLSDEEVTRLLQEGEEAGKLAAVTSSESQDVQARLAGLSDAQRALLERRLLEQRVASAASARISPREVLSPVPLSYSQELLWLLSQLEGGGVAYNAPAAFRLHGPVDAGALQQALDGLVSRHEVLRTRYDLVDDHPMQIIEPSGTVELRRVDLSGLPEDERNSELERLLHSESEHEFDLRVDRVLRPFLIKMGPDDHVFFNVMHHIATDGWSRAVLHQDLTELYDAALERREPQLDPLRIQYADYAHWHRSWLDGGVLDQQLDHWKDALRGSPSRLELPTDRPRPAVRKYAGDHTSRMLSPDVRQRLEEIARESGATLFMVLLAAYATVLHRYSGEEDIVIGTPFAGRNRSELEGMIGYFINPLALRIDLSGEPSFNDLVARAKETTLAAFAHADVPYEMVVRATSPERDLSQSPVFQVMMVLHNPDWERKRPKFEPRGVTATEIVHEKGWAKFDLLLGMSQRPAGLNTTWEYSSELFDESTAVRLGRHFEKLLESIAADPARPISQLPMLLDEERETILSRWSKAPVAFPQDKLVKDLFEDWARRTPDAEAVVFEGDRLTFRQLDERANRVAHRLRSLGVGPGRLVGIYMSKSLDLVPAVLGVVKAGGAFIPLDPMYPADRIEFMLEDARPTVIVTTGDDEPPVHGLEVAVFSEWDELEAESPEPLPTVAGSEDLAYVIYTSGSTGRPKGAMTTNGSLVNAFHAYDQAYGLTDDTTSHLQMASFSFDVFVGDLIRSLLTGSKLVLCPIEKVMDPEQLYALMLEEGVDCAEFVPAVTTMLVEHVESLGRTLEFMRVIVVSSEGWRTDKYEQYSRVCGPKTRLINAYGLTEATIDSTYFEATEPLLPDRFVPIGKPLANTEIYLLDPHLEPVPTGVAGELCIGGSGVAQGYLNRPDLNAERFIENPFGGPGSRLYRTGDLARWLPDGNVEFLGRADRQVKIRGFRIEPGEVEAVLERHDAVRVAAVIPWERRPGDVRLIAYYEPSGSGEQPDPEVLRETLAAELPAFMVPSAFIPVPAFPLTPNGKVDRAALPQPESTDFAGPASEPLRTETEFIVAQLWNDVLDVEVSGASDNFFALGGHSLLAARVISRLNGQTGVNLTLRAIFEAPTVGELASLVDRKLAEGATNGADPELKRVDRTQRRLSTSSLAGSPNEPS